MKNFLIVIVGPTAIGKTALSIALAKHFNSEIISCDSRQFYKEMRIGTAVPSEEELAAIPHHFIQNKSIFESYTVGDFEREGLEKLEELFSKNPIQIMVGGSGLYVNAILNGFDDFPEIDSSIRETLNKAYEEKGLSYLREKLLELDATYYNFLTENNPQTLENPQRMKRFVEICMGTGKPYSSFLNQKKNQRSFTPIVIGLEADRQIIYDRINQRVDLMIQEGLVEEAKNLFPNKTLNALQTVGYRELFDYFEFNKVDKQLLGNAIEEIKKNTRRFAKRQMTWFKRNEETHWFDYHTIPEKIIATIENSLKQ